MSDDGIKQPESKVKQWIEFPYPNSSQSIRRFLGMVNYYQKLVPHFSDIALPLTDLIKVSPNDENLNLNDYEKLACDNIKNALLKLTLLAYPDPKCSKFQLVTDSTQFAIGAALNQMINDEPHPIGFFFT